MKNIKLTNISEIWIGYQSTGRVKSNADGKYRLIQNKDIDSKFNLIESDIIHFNPKRDPEQYVLRKNDILFQARGQSHFAYCLTEDYRNTLAASSFYIIRTTVDYVKPCYLAWWINQEPAQRELKTLAGVTAISFINKKSLSELTVMIPELNIQDKILKISKLWEREQELSKRLNELRLNLINKICIKSITNEGEE